MHKGSKEHRNPVIATGREYEHFIQVVLKHERDHNQIHYMTQQRIGDYRVTTIRRIALVAKIVTTQQLVNILSCSQSILRELTPSISIQKLRWSPVVTRKIPPFYFQRWHSLQLESRHGSFTSTHG